MIDLFKKDPKKLLAEKYEEKAYNEDERSRNRHGSELRKLTHGQISELFEKAGDLRAEIGDIENAKSNYNLAIKNAYDKKEESRIKYKISKLNFKKKKTGIEKYFSFLAIGSFIGALAFISLNLTGNVIGTNENNSTLIGFGFFLLGLVFFFLYSKNKK